MNIQHPIVTVLGKLKPQATFKLIFRNETGHVNLPEDKSIVIYRVVQESLTNIMKHAKAKNVRISLYADKKNIRVDITDDGVGGILKEPLDTKGKTGIGIAGMREQIESFGGEFAITSVPRQGTQVKVALPEK